MSLNSFKNRTAVNPEGIPYPSEFYKKVNIGKTGNIIGVAIPPNFFVVAFSGGENMKIIHCQKNDNKWFARLNAVLMSRRVVGQRIRRILRAGELSRKYENGKIQFL